MRHKTSSPDKKPIVAEDSCQCSFSQDLLSLRDKKRCQDTN